MPNLKHDPQNPKDLLGQPIEVGDYVAWGTTYGRSPAITVAVVEKIRYVREKPGSYGRKVECRRDLAENYQLKLRPLRSTGSVTWIDTQTGKETYAWEDIKFIADPERYKAKLKTVHIVNNVVKIDKAAAEAALEALAEAARDEIWRSAL